MKSVRFCCWWLTFTPVWFAAVATGQHTPTNVDVKSATKDKKADEFSPFYFEKKLDRATAEVEFLREKTKRLQSLDTRTEVALKNIESFKTRLEGSNGLRTQLQEQVKGLASLLSSAEPVVDKQRTNSEAVESKAEQIDDQISTLIREVEKVVKPVDSIENELESIRRQRRGQSQAYENVVSDDLGRRSFYSSDFWYYWGKEASSKAPMHAEVVDRLITRAKQEIERVLDEQTSILSQAESIVQEIKKELTSVTTSLRAAEDEEERARDQLKKAYEEAKSGANLNNYLVAAIILMIISMVVLYFSLRYFRPEFARTIIRQRVLIELLSMSFLLLTVIILGTARLLDSTALAALLGTMAGYIFGQKQKQKRKKADGSAAPKEIVATTGEPTPAPPRA